MMNEDFAVFILTHGRPEKVHTYTTLRRKNYTGRIVLLVDNLDKTKDEYIKKYGDQVVIFDKEAIAKTFDQGDNFKDMRAIIYARNASFEVAKKLNIKYFVQLDDDYTSFSFRFNNRFEYCHKNINNIKPIFNSILKFFKKTPRVSSIALAQGGDFIGGELSGIAKPGPTLVRKCMNSFFCCTDRPFQFVGRINEDVNTYTHLASKGLLLFTTNQVDLNQIPTQSNSGGMTDLYLDSGTYVKSFYSIMYQPSSVTIRLMGFTSKRLHHHVNWKHTVPKILREKTKES